MTTIPAQYEVVVVAVGDLVCQYVETGSHLLVDGCITDGVLAGLNDSLSDLLHLFFSGHYRLPLSPFAFRASRHSLQRLGSV